MVLWGMAKKRKNIVKETIIRNQIFARTFVEVILQNSWNGDDFWKLLQPLYCHSVIETMHVFHFHFVVSCFAALVSFNNDEKVFVLLHAEQPSTFS